MRFTRFLPACDMASGPLQHTQLRDLQYLEPGRRLQLLLEQREAKQTSEENRRWHRPSLRYSTAETHRDGKLLCSLGGFSVCCCHEH